MIKKIILLVAVLGIFGGGFFYWWNNQADVRELNKTLPEGIRVTKSLIGNDYKVINKIDGYEFKVPREWQGGKIIEYIPEREEMGYRGASINLRGKEVGVVGVDGFVSGGDMNSDLDSWAKIQSDTFNLLGDFIKDVMGEINIVKTQESVHFSGEYTYFFKKSQLIYSITSPSEEFIRYIITNGKW